MKKALPAFLLIIVLLTTTICAPVAAAGEAATLKASEHAPPIIGEVIHGFKTIDSYEVPLIGATCYIMEHEKTGAELAYLACDDINRVFSISFRTPAENDKGIPHIFEHATLCGSEKYPDPSLFFSMTSQTYNTYLNAMTLPTSTSFPSASLSEEQLLRFVDYALSGVFYPMIMTDERAMMREAYRYELADKDADITLSGTVYSEMQGARNPLMVALGNTKKVLYPGSVVGNSAGGDPAVIPTLTHRELKDFHDTYYHPSNSFMVLYGKLNYARFLKAIDEDYLSTFDRREIPFKDDLYTPYEGYREAVYTTPVAQDARTDSMAAYGFALKDATVEDVELLNIIATTLMTEGSLLHTLMKEQLPDVELDGGVDATTVEPMFVFVGSNLSDADIPLFKSILDEVFSRIVADGLDMDMIRTVCRKQRYNEVVTAGNPSRGMGYADIFFSTWGDYGDITKIKEKLDVIARLNEYAATDAFDEAFRKHLTSPVRSAYVVTKPEPGGLERASAALKQSLIDRKAAMSDKEIEALVARTKDFAAWTAANEKNSMIDLIKVVDVKSLPEEVVVFTAKDETINGMRAVTSQVEMDDLVEINLLFDASKIPFELLQEYALLAILTGLLPTENRSMNEVSKALSDFTYNRDFCMSVYNQKDGSKRYFFEAAWSTTLDRLSDSFSLMEEILFHADYSDIGLIRMRIREYVNEQRMVTAMMPDTILDSYMQTLTSKNGEYFDYTNGIPFARFIERFENMTDEELKQYAQRMREVRDILLNQDGFIFTCIGGEKTIAEAKAHASDLYAKLDTAPREAADYAELPPLPQTPLAIVADGTLQYNGQAISFDECGFEDSGKLRVMRSLVGDKLLINVLRFQNSAYGADIVLSDPIIYVSSYRDPNLKKTFDVFARLGDLVRELQLTQEDLDGFIGKVYSSLAMPKAQLVGGAIAVRDAITGNDTFGDTLRHMREVKQFTMEDVREYAAIFDTLSEKGVKVTVGGTEAIRENSDMFSTIITDYWREGALDR